MPIKIPMRYMWTRDEAVKLAEALEPICWKRKFHISLSGSVLYRGNSWHDLDFIIYSHKAHFNWINYLSSSSPELLSDLKEFFQIKHIIPADTGNHYEDGRMIYRIRTNDKKIIDLFFLS